MDRDEIEEMLAETRVVLARYECRVFRIDRKTGSRVERVLPGPDLDADSPPREVLAALQDVYGELERIAEALAEHLAESPDAR